MALLLTRPVVVDFGTNLEVVRHGLVVSSLVDIEVPVLEELGRIGKFGSEPDHFSAVNFIARETVVGGLGEQVGDGIGLALVLENTLRGHGDAVLRPDQQVVGLLVHLAVMHFDCGRADL